MASLPSFYHQCLLAEFAKEVLLFSLSLSVFCLLVTLLIGTLTTLYHICICGQRKKLIKLCQSSASWTGFVNFLKDSSIFRARAHFHSSVRNISKTDWIPVKIVEQTYRSLRLLWNSSGVLIRCRIRFDGDLCSPAREGCSSYYRYCSSCCCCYVDHKWC